MWRDKILSKEENRMLKIQAEFLYMGYTNSKDNKYRVGFGFGESDHRVMYAVVDFFKSKGYTVEIIWNKNPNKKWVDAWVQIS